MHNLIILSVLSDRGEDIFQQEKLFLVHPGGYTSKRFSVKVFKHSSCPFK